MLNDTYSTTLDGGSHWSLLIRRGMQMRLTDLEGGANIGMLFYNPDQLDEKYNAPDTLKCQHTFKVTRNNCLYSDMGRIFASVIADDFGWHDTVCGNTDAAMTTQRWGVRNYQKDQNQWYQNGFDAFLVELAKYNLTRRDLAANLNWFSEVRTDDEGTMALTRQGKAGESVTLRFEMDTLVVLHTCPHPLNTAASYPGGKVGIELSAAEPVSDEDSCLNACEENRRGFANNHLYHLGA